MVWGKVGYGGDIPSEKAFLLQSGVVSIASTDGAFAALKEDGSVVVWGVASRGGDPGSAAPYLTEGVHSVCGNDAAFIAIKTDGSVIGWGHSVSIPYPGLITQTSELKEVVSLCA
mmetsp:Transcript_15594/g.26003  ORF Transcript_15594/g.26003 Transcript_15594/m.26003 type:complete len:115 (+) Transcript_15594:1431-1775(+)